jgi:hypothetical protein
MAIQPRGKVTIDAEECGALRRLLAAAVPGAGAGMELQLPACA